MDNKRRSMRHLEPKDDSSQRSTDSSLRPATNDSGRGSMTVAERSTTLDSRATNGTLSSLSRDTPMNAHEDTTNKEHQDDEPVQIHPTSVWGNRCYEQAYVSYVYHPSAFFLQLAHAEEKYRELYAEINEFYSENPMSNPAVPWKRGDYCIAKHKDNDFYRARIIEVPEVTKTRDIYDVVFLDYGNWDKVASKDLHTLLPKFATLTAQAIPCSLAGSLPLNGTWFDHPKAIKFFEDLVLDKYVDATFPLKTSRDYWPLTFVDLQLPTTKLNIRDEMKAQGFISEVPNEEIYIKLNHLLKHVDYFIFSIPHEGEEQNND